jgi:hypothetical protein
MHIDRLIKIAYLTNLLIKQMQELIMQFMNLFKEFNKMLNPTIKLLL